MFLTGLCRTQADEAGLLSLQPNLDGRGGGGLTKIDEAKQIFTDSTNRPVTAKSRSGER